MGIGDVGGCGLGCDSRGFAHWLVSKGKRAESARPLSIATRRRIASGIQRFGPKSDPGPKSALWICLLFIRILYLGAARRRPAHENWGNMSQKVPKCPTH